MPALDKDELITRLTRELYDLKQKLEDIRGYAEAAEQEVKQAKKINHNLTFLLIDILNEIDSSEVYES